MKIGDEIKFITNDDYIPDYNAVSDFREMIIHGNTRFKENKGIIEATNDKYSSVSFIGLHSNEKVRLTFKNDLLIVTKEFEVTYEIY